MKILEIFFGGVQKTELTSPKKSLFSKKRNIKFKQK